MSDPVVASSAHMSKRGHIGMMVRTSIFTRRAFRRGGRRQMKRHMQRLAAAAFLLVGAAQSILHASDPVETGFKSPPDSARPWTYWWWLDSAASKEGITADLQAMRSNGITGALLFDAGEGGPDAPKGPRFLSPEWRALFRHALKEADRFDIVLGVNLCSGWDCGGTWVTPEHAAKKLVWSETVVEGPGLRTVILPPPSGATNHYQDIALMALPAQQKVIEQLEVKAGRDYAAAPSGDVLAAILSGEATTNRAPFSPCRIEDVRLIEAKPGVGGQFEWQAPAGRWLLLRFGYTLLGSRTKCVSPGAEGFEIDFFSREAFDAHFAHTGQPLLEDARQSGARSLRYFHVDSYEAGNPSWTPRFREEFQKRRGYDPLRWMPVLAGRVVESSEVSHRFLWDIRRTIGDLFAANYYGRLAELSHQSGLAIHPESSGPFWHHIDALQCAGGNDVPMTEFWKRMSEDREWVWWLTDCAAYCDLVKQASSAAHTYGRPICQAESYTTMGPNWEEDPFSMKDIGDRAFCAGLTRQVLCFFVHQPRLDAYPGFQWEAAGTHFDSHVTWWGMGRAWLDYIARCQHLLRQGLPVSDFCYFYGEDVPSYVQARHHMSPALPRGFECDTVNAEVLLSRLEVRDGTMVLPEGTRYRYLVLPHRKNPTLSLPVLGRIRRLVESGATIVGPPPRRTPGLTDWPVCDGRLQDQVRDVWGESPGDVGERKLGQGRVIWGRPLAEIAAADRVQPDVEFLETTPSIVPARFDGLPQPLDWIHRSDGKTDIYFVANIGSRAVVARAAFRTAGRRPELWDAVTGQIRELPEFVAQNGRTVLPLRFEPKQSFFLVFRTPLDAPGPPFAGKNFPDSSIVTNLTGPWDLRFDPKRGGPGDIRFERLEDWAKRPEDGIRFYSGTALYRKTFDFAGREPGRAGERFYLDLGVVKNLASVRLNGRDLGAIWTAPWRVDVTGLLRASGNEIEIEVVNLWPNRLIGDALLPADKRFTTTNVKKFKNGMPLLPSGLLGPVSLTAEGP